MFLCINIFSVRNNELYYIIINYGIKLKLYKYEISILLFKKIISKF